MNEPEKLQRTDHDTLIRLEGKVDSIQRDVAELKDGISSKIADHEIRIKAIEKVIVETDLLNSYKSFLHLKEEVHDFKTTATVWRTIAGAVGGALFWLLTQIPFIWRLLTK